MIAPPSVHASGRKYAWSVDSAKEFAEAPVWLLGLITHPNVAEIDAHRPADHWKRLAQGVGEGARNHSAASLAGYLLRLGARPDVTLELLLGWNTRCKPPQDEADIEKTVVSIAERELKRRGSMQ